MTLLTAGWPRSPRPWSCSLFWQPLRIMAAIGFAIAMIGAVVLHARVGDYANPDTRGNAMAPLLLARKGC